MELSSLFLFHVSETLSISLGDWISTVFGVSDVGCTKSILVGSKSLISCLSWVSGISNFLTYWGVSSGLSS